MNSLQILRTRLALWWDAKPFCYVNPYRVVIRKKRAVGPYRRQWWYVNLLAKEKVGAAGSLVALPAQALPIGPVLQWTPEEAGQIALEQYEARFEIARNGDTTRSGGIAGIGAASSSPTHVITYVMLRDSNYRIKCGGCEWMSSPTQPGHMCQPANCAACADVHREFEEHAANLELAPPEPAIVDRQTGAPPETMCRLDGCAETGAPNVSR